MVGLTLDGPLGGRGQECLLHGILGTGEVAVSAHHRTEDLRRQFPQQALDGAAGHISGSGALSTSRTSMG